MPGQGRATSEVATYHLRAAIFAVEEQDKALSTVEHHRNAKGDGFDGEDHSLRFRRQVGLVGIQIDRDRDVLVYDQPITILILQYTSVSCTARSIGWPFVGGAASDNGS
jgi:hypothetical protein